MRKLIYTIVILLAATAYCNSQVTLENIKIYVRKGGDTINTIDTKDFNNISFEQLNGLPTCTIEVEPKALNAASIGSNLFVTVTYSEKMDKDIKPIISFSEGANNFNLVSNMELWNSDSEFFSSYVVLGKNQNLISPSITVSGARDIYGNQQPPCTLNNAFTIDTEKPYLVKIDFPDIPKICDDMAGIDFIIKLTFNEKMKKIDPKVTFTPGSALGSVFSSDNPKPKFEWINDKECHITYKIVDNNADFPAGITFTFEKALDLAGNEMDAVPGGKAYIVDMYNPKVSNLVVSKSNIKLEDDGLPFTITLTYTEAMVGNPKPDLTFTPSAGIGKILTEKQIQFDGFKKFTYTYKVKTGSENIIGIDVAVKEGEDSCSNLQVEYKKADCFNILFTINEIFREGFDTYPVGGPPPPPWERLSPSGIDNQVQSTFKPTGGEPNSLMLVGSKVDVKKEMEIRQFSPSPDEINVEFYMMSEAVTDSGGVALANKASMVPYAMLTYGTDGSVYIKSGTSITQKVTFPQNDNPHELNKWGSYKLIYNKVTGELKFFFNGTLMATTVGTVPAGSYDSILLYSFDGKVYFDNFFLWYL
jgi:hypothetical protein